MHPKQLSSIFAAAVLPALLRAQSPVAAHPLGPLMAESRENFGNINGIRALSDGRVLVNDAQKHLLLLLDKNLGLVSVVADSTPGTVNGHGGLPGALVAYAADSTLYADMNSLSFLVVDPSGKIARVMSPPRPQEVMFLAMGSPGIDPKDRLTYRAMTMPAMPKRTENGGLIMPELPDSAPIYRVDLATRKVDTAGYIRIPRPKLNITTSDDGRSMRATAEINPMPVVDEWALMSDGTLALVRGQDYHVDWINVDGTRTSSAKVPYEWQRLSDDDKVAVTDSVRKALEAAQQNGLGAAAALAGAPMAMTMTSRGGDGGNVMVGQRVMSIGVGDGGGGRAGGPAADGKSGAGSQAMINMVSPSELPDYRPAFRSNAVRPSADDKLWVATTAPIATMPGSIVYDVIDRSGNLSDRVAFPPGRQLVGFGSNGEVYITWRDGMGMHLGRARAR